MDIRPRGWYRAYWKSGTSITEENVQLMCARHNLEKGAKIL